METFVTIYTKWFMDWGQIENAFTFLMTGFSATMSYVVVTILMSKRIFEDRQLLLTGLISLFSSVLIIGVALSVSTFKAAWLVPVVLLLIFWFCIS